jgi:hypothetical protein
MIEVSHLSTKLTVDGPYKIALSISIKLCDLLIEV